MLKKELLAYIDKLFAKRSFVRGPVDGQNNVFSQLLTGFRVGIKNSPTLEYFMFVGRLVDVAGRCL